MQKGAQPKLHLATDAHDMLILALITEGTAADCTQAKPLIDGINAQYLLADRGYDSNEIVNQVVSQVMIPVMTSKRNRKVQRPYDKDLYKARHLVENAFLHLKRWRKMANQICEKNTVSFLAAIHIRCISLWALS